MPNFKGIRVDSINDIYFVGDFMDLEDVFVIGLQVATAWLGCAAVCATMDEKERQFDERQRIKALEEELARLRSGVR
jgi:hypothetical protein